MIVLVSECEDALDVFGCGWCVVVGRVGGADAGPVAPAALAMCESGGDQWRNGESAGKGARCHGGWCHSGGSESDGRFDGRHLVGGFVPDGWGR